IGAVLNPIEKLPGVANPLDPAFLIGVITNGRSDNGRTMPAKGGNNALTDQDVKDLAAYIIQQNRNPGGGALSPGELAKRTILWVSIAIIAMGFITYLLATYNMRWIARRAAARRKYRKRRPARRSTPRLFVRHRRWAPPGARTSS